MEALKTVAVTNSLFTFNARSSHASPKADGDRTRISWCLLHGVPMFICVVIWSSKKICVVIYPTLNCFFFMNVNYHTPILWNDWTPKSHQVEKEKTKNKNYWASGNKLMTIIWFILFIQSQKNSFFLVSIYGSTLDDNLLSSNKNINWFLI